MESISALSKRLLLTFSVLSLGILFTLIIESLINPPKPPYMENSFHQYKADKVLGFKPIPNAKGEYKVNANKLITVQYDEYGARVNDLTKPSHIPSDVLVVGCSQTWGHGVLEKETFTDQLANKLNKSAVNLGVPSYGGVGSLLRLKQNIEQFHPHYIVYGMWEDHANRNVRPCIEDSLPLCNRRPIVSKNKTGELIIKYPGNNENALMLSADWYNSKHHDKLFNLRWTLRKFSWRLLNKIGYHHTINALQTHSGKKQANQFVLKSMAKIAREANAKLIVVYIPSYLEKDHIHTMPKYLAQIEKDIILVNMEDAFKEMLIKQEAIAIPNDGHLTPKAHSIIAEAIAHKIQGLDIRAFRTKPIFDAE